MHFAAVEEQPHFELLETKSRGVSELGSNELERNGLLESCLLLAEVTAIIMTAFSCQM